MAIKARRRIELSEHFTMRKLLAFAAPTVFMMIFTSVYVIVDGVFVANFASEPAFAGLNLSYPYIMILTSSGYMMGAGGAAIVGKTLGQGDKEVANKYFTSIVIATIIMAFCLGVIGYFTMEPVTRLLAMPSSDDPNIEEVISSGVQYGKIMCFGLPFWAMQSLWHPFFVTAEKPHLGFLFTLAAGVMNIIGDAALVAGFRLGIAGAAIATDLAEFVGGVIPLIYFASKKNDSRLHFANTKPYFRVLGYAMGNGSSELLSNIASSVVSMAVNIQLLRYVGPIGVSAYGAFAYISFVFISAFLGFSAGVAPLYSFNFGARNKAELANLFRLSVKIIATGAVLMTGLAYALSYPFSMIFFSNAPETMEIALRCFYITSVIYLICGFSIFSGSMFTALNNGIVSAIISFARTLVFQLGSVMLFPTFMGSDGIWASVVFAEIGCAIMVTIFIFQQSKKYGYLEKPKSE